MDLTTRELLELGLDAVDTDAHEVPSALRNRVLGTTAGSARQLRHPGWVSDDGSISPLAAFIRTAAGLGAMLDTLAPGDWERPTGVEGSSVRELVAHLVGVERYVLGQLGRRPKLLAPTREDHFPITREAAADMADVAGPDVAAAWWSEVSELISVCGPLDPQHDVGYHHLGGSLRGLLVVRTFELWTHDDDIRRAVNLPPNELDDERLALMSNDLMGVLSLGMALSGTTRPGRTARVDLTGSGGGSYLVALAPGEVAGLPDITITVGTLDLCRLASNRLSSSLLDIEVDGDRTLLEPMLVGATAFAAD